MTDSNKGLRILMIEDNPGDQYLITELLDASVIKIQLLKTAGTTGQAIDILQKETFDIILLDLSLPDSSGIDTFITIKQFAGKMPVIILSGITDMNIAVEAISLGAQDYHIKGDLDEKTLTKTILYSIERKRRLEDLQESNDRYITISKAELDLMQSEEITRQIMNAALDAIICIDTYGKITVWNPQAEKIFGWQQHEILGKTLSETIIPAEYRDLHEKGIRNYLATGKGSILNRLIEITAVNRGGQHFPVELSIVPLTEGGNQFFCAFVRDITDRKKNEEALIKSEVYLRGTLDSTNDGILAIDNNGKIITTNNRFAELWQIPEGLIEQKDDQVLLEYVLDQLVDPGAFLSKVKELYNSGRTDFDVLHFKDQRVFERYSTPLLLNKDIVGRVWSFRDVTEQKRAEATVKASEQNLRHVLSSSADNFYVIDRSYRITLINKSAEKNLTKAWGRPVTVGTNILDHIPEEKDEPIRESLEKVFAGEKVEYELHISVPGLPEWVLVNYMPVNDDSGAVLGAYIVTKDITERKKADEELKDSEKRYRSLVEQASDGILVTDLQGNILEVNPLLCSMFGYTREEVLQKNVGHFLHPQNLQQQPLRLQLLHDDHPLLSERRGVHKNGTAFDIELNTNLIGDNKALSIIRNISERKQVEKLVKESEERYKALVKNAPEALVVFDVENRKFVNVSESAEKLFKMSRKELLKIGPIEVSPEYQPDGKLSSELVMEKISEAIAGGKPIFEWTHCDKEGNLIPCEVWLVRLPSETQVLIRGSIIDITIRKKAELALKESETRYRSTIEQASDFIMITDQQGDFIDANSNFHKTFGYTKEELMQLNINKVIDPEQLKKRPVRFDLLIKGETVLNERRMMTKSGAVIDVEANVKMLPDGRIMAIARDIRDRKKVEEQLSNERNLLRALIDNLPDYIYVKDSSFNYIINNRAFVKLVGSASEAENSRKNSIDLFGEKIGQINMEEDRKIFESGETVIDRDEPIVTQEGEKLWLLTTKVPLKDPEQKVVGILGISKDITERKEAERIIKESEEKYRTIIEQAPDGIFISNQDTFFVDVNRSGCSMMGYTKKELQTMRFTELISPQNLKENPIRMEELNSGKIVLSERKVVRKDGTEILVEINAQLRPDGMYQSFIRDITDRKKAEQAVQESEEKYRTLVEQAVDAIALYDASGRILDVNTGSVKLLGYSKGELMKMSLSDILTMEEIKSKPVQYDVLQKGESTVKQRMMRKKSGAIVQTEVRSQQLPDGRFLSVIRDLSERVKAQDMILKEKELSNDIIDSIPGVFFLRNKNNFLRWNKQFEIISGYSAEEISKLEPIIDFYDEKEREKITEAINRVFTEGSAMLEATPRTKDGRKIPFYFNARLINYEGKQCIVATGIDISDRKKAEQELEESYKAIRNLTEHLQNIREEERAHIAREIHDELGQQLTVLKMDISWINKKIVVKDEPVKERMKELLAMLDETVKSVRRISSELRPSLLDDLGLTAAMEWQLTEFEKRFEIKTHFNPANAEIKLSESMKVGLFRIFQESLTNVARHSQAKTVTVTLNRENSSVILSVADNGVGFDKQTAVGRKTLGILGMKERTAMIGGSYEIVSKPGKGTRIVVTIPLDDSNKTNGL